MLPASSIVGKLIEIINTIIIVASSWLFIIMSVMHGHTNIILSWLFIMPSDACLQCWRTVGAFEGQVCEELDKYHLVKECSLNTSFLPPRVQWSFNSSECCWYGMCAVIIITLWAMTHFSSTEIFCNLLLTSRCFVMATWIQCVDVLWVCAYYTYLSLSASGNPSPLRSVHQWRRIIGTPKKRTWELKT